MAIQELSQIQKQIKALKPKPIKLGNVEDMIEFNTEEIFNTLMSLIKVRSELETNQKKEEVLLSHVGLRFDITSGKKEEIKFDREIPDGSATFQVNHKFYVCGGEAKINGHF